MLPQNHFLFGLIVSVVLYLVFPEIEFLGLVVFLMATVLIDIDHYLYYIYRKRDWSLANAIRWVLRKGKILKKMRRKRRSEFYIGFYFLHGIEALILFGALGYFVWDGFYFVSLGFGFHLVLDYIHQIQIMDRIDKISSIYDYFKYGKLKFAK
ncbi:hypothetical protein K8R30_00050 [archaeon]|nr:hypothetical protein [archaeon]